MKSLLRKLKNLISKEDEKLLAIPTISYDVTIKTKHGEYHHYEVDTRKTLVGPAESLMHDYVRDIFKNGCTYFTDDNRLIGLSSDVIETI